MFKYDCALVIDEDPISNFVTTLTLEKINVVHKIKSCSDLQETLIKIKKLEKANENLPEVIILDLLGNEEAVTNFLENFKNLKLESGETVKLILLTLGSDKRIEKAKQYGYPYIIKPVTEDKLKTLL